jgi:hypothetical protein
MCSSEGVASPGFPRREKDKSSKRKSNLNRSLATEEVVCSDTALLAGEYTVSMLLKIPLGERDYNAVFRDLFFTCDTP